MAKDTPRTPEEEDENSLPDTTTRDAAEKLDGYQEYQREFRNSHLTSDEY